jgi:hypothetical protein
MHWLILIAALLFPSIAKAQVSPTECSNAGDDADCFHLDYLDYGDTGLSAYDSLVAANHAIAEAMDYEDLSLNIRTAIWQKIDQAEANDGVLDITNPAQMCGGANNPTCDINSPTGDQIVAFWVPLSQAQAYYGAKVAHALWLELSGNVPWSITDYSVANLRLLLDPRSLFTSYGRPLGDEYDGWNPLSGTETAYFTTTIDHSPKRVYDVMVSQLGGMPYAGTALEAWDALIAGLGNDLVHIVTGDPRHATTIDQTVADLISRFGCHTASRFMVALMRAINVPGDEWVGYYTGEGHSSAFLPTIDAFLPHGDNVYSANEIYRTVQAYDSNAWAQANLVRFNASNNLLNSRRSFHNRYWLFALRGAFDSTYCAAGGNITTMLDQSGIELDLPQDQNWIDTLDGLLDQRTGCKP